MTAPEFSPREAVKRWLDRQQLDKAEQTVTGYRGRLKHFVEWSESEQIERMRDLTPWDIESYETHRRSNNLAPITLRNELLTLRQFLKYCSRVGVVEDNLPEVVDLPKVEKSDQTSDTLLHEQDAKRLLKSFRSGETNFERGHAFLELAWYTGARMGALRGLDLDNVELEDGHVYFQHRPDEETPLKNGTDGERVVGISEEVSDALRTYIQNSRPKVTDDYGRRPVFATPHGRISRNALRETSYYATVPCRFADCRHNQSMTSCEWYSVTHSRQCPSSRSPHQVRSGSITWQLNRGLRADVVAKRVNASVDVIEVHYDKATPIDEFEARRQRHLNKLNFDEETNE